MELHVLCVFRHFDDLRETRCALSDLRWRGIVSKSAQKLVGRLTLFQGISQVLGHRKTT
jgi:hypothetical protein